MQNTKAQKQIKKYHRQAVGGQFIEKTKRKLILEAGVSIYDFDGKRHLLALPLTSELYQPVILLASFKIVRSWALCAYANQRFALAEQSALGSLVSNLTDSLKLDYVADTGSDGRS